MAWYVGQDGQQLWIQRDESVYTVIQPVDKLAVENLSYLAKNSTKAVFQEHLIEEDIDGKNSKRQRNRMAGKQRGFVVRIEQDEQLRVVPWFKAATTKLLDLQVVSRVDADDAVNMKKKKKADKATAAPNLGVNECRIETTARIYHFAHGPGFRVEVNEGDVGQRIHFFTNKREVDANAWHSFLVDALESTGAHVMIARRTAQDAEQAIKDRDPSADIEQIRMMHKDPAQKEDEAWAESLLQGGVEGDDDTSSTDEAQDSPTLETMAQEAPTKATAASASTPAPRDKARPGTQAAASEVPEWRRRDGPQLPANPTFRKSDSKQQPSSKQQSSSGKQKKQPEPKKQPSNWQPLLMANRRQPPAASPLQQPVSRNQQPSQAPSGQPGWFRDHFQLQQQQPPAPPPQAQAPRQSWQEESWQGESWQGEEQRWQPQLRQEGYRQEPTRHQQRQPKPPQAAQPPNGYSLNVRDLFSRAQEEETGLVSMGNELRDMLIKCGECGRGRPLKLCKDDDDDQWYCRRCWLNFYGVEPPAKR